MRPAAGAAVPGRAPTDAQPLRPDAVQARVIAHTAGPLLVVGGAGTGKTSTLVEAVAARVADGVSPDRILVLTFGRRTAGALRNRIEARIGAAGRATAEPLVRTFHAYAFGLLRLADTQRGEPPPRLLTGPEQDLVIRELLEDDPSGWPESLGPALHTRAFAGQLRDLLLRCAERGVDPAGLAGYARRAARPEWLAAARFMREYEQVQALRDATGRAGVAYDNAELVRAAAELLADVPELADAERRRLAAVYVDELADTDPAQVELLHLVAGDGAHLVAFGDPDSSTYGFRGAAPEIVRDFPDRFGTPLGPAPVTALTTSYRAGPQLLAAAARVLPRRRSGSVVPPVRPLPDAEPGSVEVHTFRSTASEAAYVAHRLREAHLRDEVPWHRMAVILRSTTLALAGIQRALAQAGVPVTTHADDLPLREEPGVRPLLLALRCALEPARLDEAAAVALLHSPLGGADPLAERRLRQGLRALALAAGDRRPSGVLLVEALRDPTELAAVERRWARPAQAVARLLTSARDAAARPGATAEDVLWALWQASGLAARWTAESGRGGYRGAAADRDLDAVMVLFDAAARFVDRLPGARIEVFLDHVEGQVLPADTLARTADRGSAVRLLTAHAAKGLEWDVVVVAGVQEGVWPDLRLRGSVLGSEQLVDLVAGRAIVPTGPDRPWSGPAAVPAAAPAAPAGPAAGEAVPLVQAAGDAVPLTQPAAGGAVPLVQAVSQTAALLAEERRLFAVAVTRARQRLVVTAVHSGDGEEQPSRFLHELRGGDSAQREPVATRPPRALTLPALVAELRQALVDPATPPARRDAATASLAKLALAGVPGADPDQWWGLAPLSDERPLVDADGVVTVSPSTVESVQRCSLRWLLERHGGSGPRSPEQSVGDLVHEIAQHAQGPGARDELIAYLRQEFGTIELSARWLAERQQRRAEQMVDKLMGWLAANPRRLVAVEQEFAVHLDEGTRIRGRVDRLEMDEAGRLVVIDLKTGSAAAERDGLPEHPQLGAYQAAVEAGAFAEGDVPGGAALVQLGTDHKAALEQEQPALAETADPGWAAGMVRRTAAAMAASTFHAVANSRCRSCPVRHSCPISGKGRQVSGDDPGRPAHGDDPGRPAHSEDPGQQRAHGDVPGRPAHGDGPGRPAHGDGPGRPAHGGDPRPGAAP